MESNCLLSLVIFIFEVLRPVLPLSINSVSSFSFQHETKFVCARFWSEVLRLCKQTRDHRTRTMFDCLNEENVLVEVDSLNVCNDSFRQRRLSKRYVYKMYVLPLVVANA